VVQVHLGPPLQFLVSLTFTAVTHCAEPTWVTNWVTIRHPMIRA
jgi:hypothetical protein